MKEPTDTEILDWLERNLLGLHHAQATHSVDMGGIKVTGQLLNEARGDGAGSSYFTIRHKSIREAVKAAMNNKPKPCTETTNR